jgi:hypothetical protein
MNSMFKQGSFRSQGASSYGCRFEKPESALSGSPAICVQFGSRLRRMFEVPCADSQPDQFEALLNQLEAKLQLRR